MRTLMTATALAALVAASSAFGQAQDPAQDPLVGEPPAATEPAPASPEATPDATNPTDAMPAEPTTPDVGAEAEPPATPDAAPADTASADKFITQQDADDVLASTLIGTSVQNGAGESLGSINDVVLSAEGQADVIVIGVGGFLGIGEKNIGVAFDAIEKSTDANGNTVLVFDATAEELEAAPAFVTIAEMQQQEQMEQPAAPTADPMAPAPAPAQ
jgi:sporulation protein YlmC with PRC-barrel domain